MQTNKTYFFAIRNIIVENKGVETLNLINLNVNIIKTKKDTFKFELSKFKRVLVR